MVQVAFQDQIEDNFCFGCGPTNEQGLQIKSYWDGVGKSTCTYNPEPHQTAGPRHILNGGIIATLIDCHCVCTAIAYAYEDESREIGSTPAIWYATGKLTVSYLRPTPIAAPVKLMGRLVEATDRKTVIRCSLRSRGEDCVKGEVVAIRVSGSWRGAG